MDLINLYNQENHMYRYILTTLGFFLFSATALLAEEEGHHLSPAAVEVTKIFGFPITNSMIISWTVTLLLVLFVRIATRNISPVPGKMQNFVEAVIEGLYNFFTSIVGNKVIRSTFWFFSAILIFILSTNWFSLIPGVGSIGWGYESKGEFVLLIPLLRGGNADLNLPCAMAMIFFLCWIIWAFKFNGTKGIVKELFGFKGGSDIRGFLFYILSIIFICVGFIEVISICFRPISLMFRLFGNIYAGEVMIETLMGDLGPLKAALATLPIYFLETLVGLVQAFVFSLLTAVFTATMCSHEEGSENTAH